MTVFLTTTLITVLAFGTLMAMRRGALNKIQPIQAIFRWRERRPQQSKTGKPAKKVSPFHAVTIELDPHPCAAVDALKGQKLLSRDAPVLPVSGCDQAQCQCRFVHHSDRRGSGRRGYQSSLGQIAAVGSNNERRQATGRRENDFSEEE